MNKLIATFYYKGSANHTIYRKVEVLSICEIPLKLFGFEKIRNTENFDGNKRPFKSYVVDKISGLQLSQVRTTPTTTANVTVAAKLRELADILEGA